MLGLPSLARSEHAALEQPLPAGAGPSLDPQVWWGLRHPKAGETPCSGRDAAVRAGAPPPSPQGMCQPHQGSPALAAKLSIPIAHLSHSLAKEGKQLLLSLQLPCLAFQQNPQERKIFPGVQILGETTLPCPALLKQQGTTNLHPRETLRLSSPGVEERLCLSEGLKRLPLPGSSLAPPFLPLLSELPFLSSPVA